MAGLLQQGMQQPQQAPQPPQQAQRPPQQSQAPQQPQEGGERTVNAPPEEAAPQFEALLESMLGYLYDQGMEQVAQTLQQGGDPVERMGMVIGTIMVTTHNMLAQEGKTVPPNVMVRAGMELAKAVGEMATEMGLLDDNADEAIEAAFMFGIGRFGKNAEGITPEQKQRYGEIIGMMKEAKGRSREGGQPPQGQRPPQGAQQRPQQPQAQGGM